MYHISRRFSISFILISLGLLTLFLPPFFLQTFGSTYTLYVGEFFFVALGLIWIISMLQTREVAVNNLVKLFSVLLVTGSFSTFGVENLGRHLFGYLVYFEAFLLVLLFSNITFEKRVQVHVIKHYLYAGVVLALFIVYKTIIMNDGNFILGQKIVLEVGASNYLATILLIPFFIAFTNIFRGGGVLKNLVIFGLLGIALIYTGSRTVLFIAGALTASFVIIEILFANTRLIRKVISIFLFAVGGIIVYFLSGSFVQQMVNTGRFDNLSQQSNLLERFVIFRQYFDAFLENPLFGNGFSNVDALNNYYLAHNFVLQLLGDNGLVGCLIFIAILFNVNHILSKNIKKSGKSELTIFMVGFRRGFYAVLLHGMLEPNFGTKLFMIYLFLGVGIIIASLRGNQSTFESNCSVAA